ncbi:MAG TPA: hypothetical protein VFS43_46295 [Polyangiaceae bacterium]|nr:hypothetical protein [Polyangiaceae bacterium]
MLFGALLRGRWFWLGAWAWWLVLTAPRLAFASTAGVCDERGASAVAPLVVRALADEKLGPGLPAEPALCQLGAGLSCSFDEGRPLGPQASDPVFIDALALPSLVARLRSPWVEPGWPSPRGSSGPVGWPRLIEHPPRAGASRRF